MPRSHLFVAVAIVAVCVVFALTPFPGNETFVDQRIYRQTTEGMRDGRGYYGAMDTALRDNTGPAGSVRAFRLPTVFLLWRVLPTQFVVWILFVALVGGAGILLARVTDAPLAPLAFVAYALHLARPLDGGAWFDQFLIVELWALVGAAVALACWRLGRDGLSAAAATAATLVRELAAGMLIGGFVAAHLSRRARRPWIVGVVAVALTTVVHVVAVDPHLVEDGTEIALWGTGGPSRVIDMLAWDLPWPWLIGPVMWALAWYRVAADRAELALVGPHLVIPALGFFVGRTYWGFVVSPLLAFLAVEGAARAVARARLPIARLAARTSVR